MTSEIGATNKLFNLREAKSLAPVVQSITQKHQTELAPVRHRLSKMLSNDPRRPMYEQQYESIVSRWRQKIIQLGATVVGLWDVQFDVGEGGLSWRHPELSLAYFCEHDSLNSQRVKLADYIETHDPDWAR